MPSLPILSGQEVVRVFESLGWKVARQRSSHIVMIKEGEVGTLSIPNHKEGRKRNVAKLDPFCKSHGGRIHTGDLNHIDAKQRIVTEIGNWSQDLIKRSFLFGETTQAPGVENAGACVSFALA